MKKEIMICALFCLIALTSWYAISESRKSVASMPEMFLLNVEALADTEIDFPDSDYFHCRCHNENNGWCLGGNAVSLRRSCHKEPAGSGNNIECHDWDTNCY